MTVESPDPVRLFYAPDTISKSQRGGPSINACSCAYIFYRAFRKKGDINACEVTLQSPTEHLFISFSQASSAWFAYFEKAIATIPTRAAAWTTMVQSEARAARDVEIHDRFPDTDFTFLHGSRSTRWTSIAPGTNITHAVIVIPRFVGGYNFTSAEVLYKAGADSKVTHGYSSAPGVRYVVTPSHFNRQFASHWLEWICFAFITAPCIVIPYMLWRSGASKYM